MRIPVPKETQGSRKAQLREIKEGGGDRAGEWLFAIRRRSLQSEDQGQPNVGRLVTARSDTDTEDARTRNKSAANQEGLLLQRFRKLLCF